MRTRICSLLAVVLLTAAVYAFAAPPGDSVADYTMIQIEREGPILIGKFHNPPRHVMNSTMVAELSDLVARVAADDSVRVLVLTGAAAGVFIAHYDTSEIGRKGAEASTAGEIAPDGARPELHAMHQALLAIERLPKPVIAAINGRAHGGGLETALACDFRLITQDGYVGLPEVGIGIIPGAGGTQRLPRLIGLAKARELVMLGTSIDGVTAERFGLVTRAVAADQLMAETLSLARQLAAKPAVSVAAIKRVLREGLALPLEEALVIEQDAYYKASRSAETRALRQRTNVK